MRAIRTFLFCVLLILPIVCVEAQQVVDSTLLEAQPRVQVVEASPLHGLELGLDFGPHFYAGEYDLGANIYDWWTFPVVDFSATYWFGRVIGVGATFSYVRYKGLSRPTEENSVFMKPSDPDYFNTGFVVSRGGYLGVTAMASVDVAALFSAKPDRSYRMIAMVGGGVMIAVQSEKSSTAGAFQATWRNSWMVSDNWTFDLSFTGSLIKEEFDGKYGEKSDENFPIDGALGITIGTAYRF